jgi:hypothetical protein
MKASLTILFALCTYLISSVPAMGQFKAQDIQTFALAGDDGEGSENCTMYHNTVTPPGWEWQWNAHPLCLWIDPTLSKGLDDNAREYQLCWGTTPPYCDVGSGYGGALFHARLNADGDPDTTDSEWSWSIWVYYPSLTNIDQLEFDFNQVASNGNTIIMAAQCNFAVSGGGSYWQIFNGWTVTTTLACPQSQWLNTAGNYLGWHHVVISAHWENSTECGNTVCLTYDSISFDNATTSCADFTDTCMGQGDYNLGWTAGGPGAERPSRR